MPVVVRRAHLPLRREPAAQAPSCDRALRDRTCAGLIVLVWFWLVLPSLVQSLTAPKFRGSVGGDVQASTPLTAQIQGLLTLLVLGASVLAVILTLRSQKPAPLWPLVAALSPWLLLFLHDQFLGVHALTRTYVYPFLAVALWQLRPSKKVLPVLGYLTGLAALVAIALALLVPDKGLFQAAAGGLVDEDKELLPIGILVGFLTHGNSMGQFLGLGLPFVATIARPWHRYVLLAVTVMAIIWTASRSAIGGDVAIAIVAMAIAVSSPARRHVVGAVAVVGAFASVVLLPLLVTNPEAFTNRGLIWSQSLTWFQESPWIGLGSRWYSVVGNTSERLAATVFHGHNEMVQLLVTGGLVIVVLVVLLLMTTACTSTRLLRNGGSSVGLLFLIGLAVNCALEIPMSFLDNFGLFPATVPPLLFLLFTDEVREAATNSSSERMATVFEKPTTPSLREYDGGLSGNRKRSRAAGHSRGRGS